MLHLSVQFHSIAFLLACSMACGELVYNDPVVVISDGGSLNFYEISWGTNGGSSIIVTDGLISYYPFTGNAEDGWGNADGTVDGATLTNGVSGAEDTAYYFDDDRITLSTNLNSSLDGSTNFSLAMWLHSDAIGDVDEVFGSWASGQKKIGYYLYASGKQFLSVSPNGGSTTTGNGTTGIAAGSWQHIAVAFNSGAVTFYVNGILAGTDTGLATDAYASANPYSIGWWYGDSAAANSFEGRIDEVRIYDNVITSNNVYLLAHEFD